MARQVMRRTVNWFGLGHLPQVLSNRGRDNQFWQSNGRSQKAQGADDAL